MNVTIDKYCYVTSRFLPPFFDYKYRVRYRIQEETNDIHEIQHPSVRECLKFLQFEKGIEMQHNADVPGMSGLGSSSAFTVGFLNTLYALKDEGVTKKQLALNAIHVEQNLIRENVGSQDQTSTAFGGLNKIEFGGEERIRVFPVLLDSGRLQEFQDHLLLFFTGFPRSASEIAAEQIANTPRKEAELTRLRGMVDEAYKILVSKNKSIDEIGGLLHEGWMIKRTLSNKISNSSIDIFYERAKKAGALGGKLLGAGGGGFMLVFACPENQPRIKDALKDLLFVPFKFENEGSQIIYRAPSQDYV